MQAKIIHITQTDPHMFARKCNSNMPKMTLHTRKKSHLFIGKYDKRGADVSVIRKMFAHIYIYIYIYIYIAGNIVSQCLEINIFVWMWRPTLDGK